MGNFSITKSKDTIFGIVKTIKEQEKDAEDYGTGMVGEKVIVCAYQSMTIDKLEKLRFILNKIIKKKKIALKNEKENVNKK